MEGESREKKESVAFNVEPISPIQSPGECKYAQKVPRTFAKPKIEVDATVSQADKREINQDVDSRCLQGPIYMVTYSNPMFDTSDPASRALFQLFSSGSITHLTKLPEKSTFWIAELDSNCEWSGKTPLIDRCKLCGDPQHDEIRELQDNAFRHRFGIFERFTEPSAVVEYEYHKGASFDTKPVVLFSITVTTPTERQLYEFGGLHLGEIFPVSIEETVFCIESLSKLSFDFLFNMPDSPFKGIKQIVFWDVTQSFRTERGVAREVLFFYPLSNTYDFKTEVDFLADGHGRPANDFVIIPVTKHKKYLTLIPGKTSAVSSE